MGGQNEGDTIVDNMCYVLICSPIFFFWLSLFNWIMRFCFLCSVCSVCLAYLFLFLASLVANAVVRYVRHLIFQLGHTCITLQSLKLSPNIWLCTVFAVRCSFELTQSTWLKEEIEAQRQVEKNPAQEKYTNKWKNWRKKMQFSFERYACVSVWEGNDRFICFAAHDTHQVGEHCKG